MGTLEIIKSKLGLSLTVIKVEYRCQRIEYQNLLSKFDIGDEIIPPTKIHNKIWYIVLKQDIIINGKGYKYAWFHEENDFNPDNSFELGLLPSIDIKPTCDDTMITVIFNNS